MFRGLLTFGVFVDVFDRVFHGGHLFGILVGHFDAEGFLKRHHQFYLIERVCSQVVYERRRGRHFRFIHAELLDDNLLYALFYASHSVSSAMLSRCKCYLGPLTQAEEPALLARSTAARKSCVRARRIRFAAPRRGYEPDCLEITALDNLPLLFRPTS